MGGEKIYNCPHCGKEIKGFVWGDVYCSDCNITFEVEFEESNDNMFSWFTGREWEGKFEKT